MILFFQFPQSLIGTPGTLNYLSERTRAKKKKKKKKRLHFLRLAFLKRLLPHLHQGIFPIVL